MSKDRVGKKISILRHEGVKRDQAIATALNMERKHRLTESGGYRRVGHKRGRTGRRRKAKARKSRR